MDFDIKHILNIKHYNNLSQNDLISIINVLKNRAIHLENELNSHTHKIALSNKNSDLKIYKLQDELNNLKIHLDSIIDNNKKLYNKINHKLTLWERITGKVKIT